MYQCDDVIFNHPWDAYAPWKRYENFQSLEEYKSSVVEALCLLRLDGIHGETKGKLKEKIPSFNDESSINLGIMTHGDINLRNIMVWNRLISGVID